MKQTLSPQMLKKMEKFVDLESPRQACWWSMITIGVYGALRIGEITLQNGSVPTPLNRRRTFRDLTFQPSKRSPIGIDLNIEASKADPFRKGHVAHIGRSPVACPVKALQNWLVVRKGMGLEPNLDDDIFVMKGKGVTRAVFMKITKEFLVKIGEDPTAFSGVSLRKGGATAARDAGLEESVIAALGRWKSCAMLLYIRESPAFFYALASKMANY